MSTLIINAARFAAEKHKGQTRKISKMPYAIHPSTVAWLITVFKKSKHIDELVAAGLLHDIVEDCGVTIDEIGERFGFFVASIVNEVTNDPTIKDWDEKHAYMIGKLLTMSSYALTLKLCDMLANLSDCTNDEFSKSFKRKIRMYIFALERYRTLTQTQKSILKEIHILLT